MSDAKSTPLTVRNPSSAMKSARRDPWSSHIAALKDVVSGGATSHPDQVKINFATLEQLQEVENIGGKLAKKR